MGNVYSVSQINNYIKQLLSRDRILTSVSISGEVSNCKYHSSGHIYFTIKDDGGQLTCVMFAGKRTGLTFKMEEGQSVIVTGSINVYERDGKYQLYAERIEQAGIGILYERFEKLKSQLLSEGLFDEAHKKKIPTYIRTLGVITAETGAALQDILNITHRRNPFVQVILYPARVQGQGAAKTLIAGIKKMEEVRPDVIIIGRGGGSIEDLFEFNDEGLARAIYDCTIPVISAVGHEVDFTICDYVSDLRAPTPSAAAELAVFEYNEIGRRLVDYHSSLLSTMLQNLSLRRMKCDKYLSDLNSRSPKAMLNNYRYRLTGLEDSVTHAFEKKLTSAKHRLSLYAGRLETVSPLSKLSQGYSYLTNIEGHNLRSIKGVSKGDHFKVQLADGTIEATVDTVSEQNQKVFATDSVSV